MVKTRAKGVYKKKRHTGRNLSILAAIVLVVIVGVAVSGVLAPATFVVIVHAYDRSKGNPQTVFDLTENELVGNVTVWLSGGSPATQYGPQPAFQGITAFQPLPAGNYNITITCNSPCSGYASNTIMYQVGPNCIDRTPDGQCHPLVPLTKTS